MRTTVLVMTAMLATAAPATLHAQDTTTAVRPGMSELEVRQRWGDPVAVRRVNDWTYLFYRNNLERELWHLDVVFLQGGQVVDAIIRMPGRVYLGTSSSPEGRVPEYTPPGRPGAAGAAAVGGARINPTSPPPES